MSKREKKLWEHVREDAQQRQVRKEIRRNRKPKRVRSKEWMPDSLDDADELYELDVPASERVMPRGERERRQRVMTAALQKLHEEAEGAASEPVEAVPALRARDSGEEPAAGLVGTVIEVSSGLCRVRVNGHQLLCGLRGSLSAEDTGFTNVVAVGDRVVVSEAEVGQGVVETVLPRRSALARPDVFYGHLQQLIVANADHLLIVAAWRDPPLWMELVDRYLIAAERHGLRPILCVNKIDLAEDVQQCRGKVAPYLELGYEVLFTSVVSGAGIDLLRDILRDKTTVLAGMSGVGKSSLLTAVQPGFQLKVAEVSDDSHEGRHTTTQVNLLELEMGGFVVDTPGIREFGLSGLERGELVRFYPEIAALQGRCRFGDCSHTHEPGCAVKAALRSGRLCEDRYHSYRAILSGLA